MKKADSKNKGDHNFQESRGIRSHRFRSGLLGGVPQEDPRPATHCMRHLPLAPVSLRLLGSCHALRTGKRLALSGTYYIIRIFFDFFTSKSQSNLDENSAKILLQTPNFTKFKEIVQLTQLDSVKFKVYLSRSLVISQP